MINEIKNSIKELECKVNKSSKKEEQKDKRKTGKLED